MDPLAARLVTDAVVYPTIRVASRPGRLLMGVYDGSGAYVDGTVLDRRSGEQGAPVPRDLYDTVVDAGEREAIYAGPLYHAHFGHFLLESLARAWFAARHPTATLVWAGQHDWQDLVLTSWQTEILDVLGITNPTRVVADPTRFARLHVPDLGYRYDDRFHPEHAAFLGRHRGPAQEPGRRLWLSRSAIGTDARDLNAEAVERWLVRAGWGVVHPEALGVRDQLDELSRAETVAGEEGSAFHALVLLDDVSRTRFHVLRRHGPEHPNMHTVGDARHVTQTFHDVPGQRVLSARGRVVSKLSPSAAGVLDLLEVPVVGAQTVPTDVEAVRDPADRTVGRTLRALAPARLLDVGAAGPGPVACSGAAVRVAVSRRLEVDPRVLARAGVETYELDLERYAEVFHQGREPFDVIRVAGSDLAEVVESFRVSKGLAHDGTVWVLGCGDLAARAALVVRLLHPGYAPRRLVVARKLVVVVERVPDVPRDVGAVRGLPAAQVRRRVRRLRPVRLAALRGGRRR